MTDRRYQHYTFGHSTCICGGKAIFQYDFKRRKNFEQQKEVTVNVYKCAECGKLWQKTVKPESEV